MIGVVGLALSVLIDDFKTSIYIRENCAEVAKQVKGAGLKIRSRRGSRVRISSSAPFMQIHLIFCLRGVTASMCDCHSHDPGSTPGGGAIMGQ